MIRESRDLDRNLALLAYALLFFAVFFAGAPALIAAAIAYTRKPKVSHEIAIHHGFQITIFWVGLGLTLLTAGASLAAVLSAFSQLVRAANELGGFPGWDDVWLRLNGSRTIGLFLTMAVGLGVLTGLWLAGASAWGFVRLAYGRTPGQSGGESR